MVQHNGVAAGEYVQSVIALAGRLTADDHNVKFCSFLNAASDLEMVLLVLLTGEDEGPERMIVLTIAVVVAIMILMAGVVLDLDLPPGVSAPVMAPSFPRPVALHRPPSSSPSPPHPLSSLPHQSPASFSSHFP